MRYLAHSFRPDRLCKTVKINPITDLERPWKFQEFEAPRFQDNRHMKAAFTTSKYSWYSFLLEAGRIMSIKNSNGTIGNRTRYLQAGSAVPNPTVVKCNVYLTNFKFGIVNRRPVLFFEQDASSYSAFCIGDSTFWKLYLIGNILQIYCNMPFIQILYNTLAPCTWSVTVNIRRPNCITSFKNKYVIYR